MANWTARGPFGIFGQQYSANIPAQGNPIATAVNTVVVKPGDPNTLFIATDGGGVWVTHNALLQNMNGIHWEPLTDSCPSQAITALAIDPLDASGDTLFAATTGPRRTLMQTTNGGRVWVDRSGGIFDLQSVARIVPTTTTETTGAVVLVGAAEGVYRSANGGITWTRMLSGNATSLVVDPGNPERFYAGVAGKGVFRSDPDPATGRVGLIWVDANGNLDALRPGVCLSSDPVRLSVHHNTETGSEALYAVLNVGNAHHVFFSIDQGQRWALMDDFPNNGEYGGGRGINEIAADRLSPNIVYIGGVAGVYEGNRTRQPGYQWAHLAGAVQQVPLPGSANGTGEHGDSRWLTFDAHQNLLEGNDGGIYRLVQPKDPTKRVWQSLNGDLNATQFYSVAFDSLNNMLLGGSQDNGVAGEISRGTSHMWGSEEDIGGVPSWINPEWSNEEDLSGVLSSGPAASSWGYSRLDIFYRGQNDHLWHRWWDGNQWNNEEDLGGALTSSPAAVSWGFNRIDIFYRGQNNHLWHRWWDGNQWTNEEDLGGVLTSAPAAASWGNNRLDIFYRGQNDHLWHRWWDGNQWNNEEDLGGALTSSPAAVSWGFNRIDIFYRGQNNHLWHRWWDGNQWTNEEDLGGVLTSAPAAASWGNNRLDIFYRGQNDHLWHRWWDGAQWSNEEDLGGVLTADPAAVSWGFNRIDVFYRGQNSHLWHRFWNGEEDLGGGLPSSGPGAASWGPTRLDIFYSGQNHHLWHRYWDQGHWNNEEDLGGVLTSNPAAVSWGFNRIDVFYRGQNNHLWHRWWDGNQWTNEEDLGGVLTSAPAAASWGNNRLDIFYRGQNGHLWHRWWDGAQWSNEEHLGGVLTSSPAAVSWGFNRIDVLYRGQSSHLWHRWWDGNQWHNEEDLGGILSSSPAVASWGPNRLDVFYRGLNQALWRRAWDGAQWLQEEHVGGFLRSAPATISSGPNRVDVFYSSSNLRLWHRGNLGVPPPLGNSRWLGILAADGGTVQVETRSEPNIAHQYFSTQNLGNFTRRRLNLATGVDTSAGIGLVVLGTNGQRLFQLDNTVVFVQPYVLNQIDPTRLLIGTTFLYESYDRGDTLVSLGGVVALGANQFAPQQPVGAVNPNVGYYSYNPIVYGGRSNGIDNADLIWVGAGGNLYLRSRGNGMPARVNTYTDVGGQTVFAIAVDPSDWQKAFVLDANGNIWRTTDAGMTEANWANFRRNIGDLTSDLQDLVYLMGDRDEVLLVSGQDGVYAMINPGPGTVWNRFGNGLPNVVVTDLRYYGPTDLLVAGTFGRGAWVVTHASQL